MKRFFVIVLALFITGCITQSDVPIRAATGEEFDARLAGVWVENIDEENVYLHIGISKGVPKFIVVDHHGDGEVSIEELPIVTACLTNGCFVSYSIGSQNHPRFIFSKYALSADSLTIQNVNEKFLRSAIKSGLINGEYHGEDQGARIQATEAELRDFIEKYSVPLFSGETYKFSRLR